VISKKLFVKKLRELGYSFKNRTKSEKNEMYRKVGGTHHVFVPRTDKLSEIYVMGTLRQCGMTEDDVESFMAESEV
jgi:hypothetical protein